MANTNNELFSNISQSAFAFRGYNVTNLGRTPELLTHPAYGSIIAAHLKEASQLCADILKRPVDLVARVRDWRETKDLSEYGEDVAMIVAVEIAHLRLLEEFFGITMPQAKSAFGYSLGECAALIGAGVYGMTDLLTVPLELADDCANLAHEVTLGILISRGPILDLDVVHRLCLEITQEGKGVIDVSTYLSPNSLLLMGQNGSLRRLQSRVREAFSDQVTFRPHKHRYPPLHTPIMWQRSIPNRAAVRLQTTPGGFRAPSVPILSMVTGTASYQAYNSRDLLHRWVDHPQRLWEIIYRVLADGVETVIHVGPNPNLLPATFHRLSTNISAQTNGRGFGGIGRRTISRLVRRPWLTRVLPSSAVLFRAPFVKQIVLEDWLLEHSPEKSSKPTGEPSVLVDKQGVSAS